MEYHSHRVRIYYEDTDLSGIVYHANYLKYFERAREHLIGPDELVRLLREEGIGFVVYKATLTYRKGAELGDELEIRTVATRQSPYRALFVQTVWRDGESAPIVEGEVEMVCVNEAQELVPLPTSTQHQMRDA